MASELLKRQALINRLKEPKTANIDFDLAGSALDYSIELIEEDILPKAKPAELFEERERVRTERLSDTLTKIGGGLMDESVDFIKREEFKVGTYPKTNKKDLKKLREYLKSLPNNSKILTNPLQRKFNIARETIALIVKREFPNLNLLKAGAAQAKNVEEMNRLRKEATEAGYEKILKEGYLDDYKLKIQKPSGSPFTKGLTNSELAKKYFPNVPEGTGVGRIEKLNRYIRKKYPNLIYPPGEPTSATSKRRRERILEQRKFLSEEEKKIRKKQKAQKKILNKYFSNNPEEILNKKEVKKLVDVKLKDGKLDFTPRYKTDKEYIDLAKKGLLFDEYDITPVRLEKRNIEFPINKNVTPAKFNQGFIKQVDAYFKKTKGSTDPDVIANKKVISNFLNSYGLTLETRGERIGSPTKLPAINKETGELPNIKNTLNKLGVGNLSTSENVGLKTKDIEKAVKKLSGEKKLLAFDELSSRVGSGVDPDLAARAVKEQFVDPLTSRVPTGKGIRALSTLGKITLPELFFAPFSSVYDIYQGRTPKEILLNIATLGAGAPALDTFKKAQALKKMGLLDDYKRAVAKANRADQALAEEVETLGMDTPAEEFAKPEFTKTEEKAAFEGDILDEKLIERLAQKADEYERTYESELKKGLLEVTPDDEPLLEEMGIKPEFLFQEEDEKSLGFFDRATGNVPRGFMSEGGIMAIRNKDKSDETN